MRIRRLNERIETYDVVELLGGMLKSWNIETIDNTNSEDINEVIFTIEYDYSTYDSFAKFFNILKRLNIKWYFKPNNHLTIPYIYLICYIHDINKEEFELLSQSNKYNL